MKYVVKKGTEILAVNYSGVGPSLMSKTTVRDVSYKSKDVQIDPVGKLGEANSESLNFGGQMARDGYFGFRLPKNSQNFETLLVHRDDVVFVSE